MSGGCVYIMTNRPNGIHYTGVIQQKHETHSARAGIVAVITDALLNPSSEDLRNTDRPTQQPFESLSAKRD
jgi:hypothetical protein